MKSKFHLTLKKKALGLSIFGSLAVASVASFMISGCGANGDGDLQYADPLLPDDIEVVYPTWDQLVCSDLGENGTNIGVIIRIKNQRFCGNGIGLNDVVKIYSTQETGDTLPIQLTEFRSTAQLRTLNNPAFSQPCTYEAWPMGNLNAGTYVVGIEGGTISTLYQSSSVRFRTNGQFCGAPFYPVETTLTSGRVMSESPQSMLSEIYDPNNDSYHFDGQAFAGNLANLWTQFGAAVIGGAPLPLNSSSNRTFAIRMSSAVDRSNLNIGTGGVYVTELDSQNIFALSGGRIIGTRTEIDPRDPTKLIVFMPEGGSADLPCGGVPYGTTITKYFFVLLSSQVIDAATGKPARPSQGILKGQYSC